VDGLIVGGEAAVAGLTRSDPRATGLTRERAPDGFRYRDPAGALVTDPAALRRIGALVLPPGWRDVWISPDPRGHIQATGVDTRGRTQYRYHDRWREQRDAQKFTHMLRFALALPGLRDATRHDLDQRHLSRDRVAAAAAGHDLDQLFAWEQDGAWRPLHSHDVSRRGRQRVITTSVKGVAGWLAG
jgi:DNA topoisomerase IB